MRRVVLCVAVSLMAVACDSATDPIVEPEWSAELSGAEGFGEAAGEATVVRAGTSFTAAIEIIGVAAGDYDWELAAGTCEEPGDRIGAAASYTGLTAGENGQASAEVTVSGTLQPTGAYHVAVFRMVGEEGAEQRLDVACGDLTRTN